LPTRPKLGREGASVKRRVLPGDTAQFAQAANQNRVRLRSSRGYRLSILLCALGDSGRNFSHLVMDTAIRRKYDETARTIWLPAEVGNGPARLSDQQHSRCRVPRVQPEFPEGVEAAARHRAEISAAEPSRRTPWER